MSKNNGGRKLTFGTLVGLAQEFQLILRQRLKKIGNKLKIAGKMQNSMENNILKVLMCPP